MTATPPPPPPLHTHTHTLISRSGSGTAGCSRIRCQQQCFVNNPRTTLARIIILPPPTCVLTYNYTRITLRIYVLLACREQTLSRLLFAPRRLRLRIHEFYISFNVSGLNNICNYHFKNKAMIAWWNDW